MRFSRLLSASLFVAISTPTAAVGQAHLTPVSTAFIGRLPGQAPFNRLVPVRATLATPQESDSLLVKRNFFSSTITQQGNRLSHRSIVELLTEVPQARTLYRRAQLLKPMGPVLMASGLVIGYIAVKGTPKTAYAKGIGTPTNPSPPDVLVDYTSRSLPQLLGGLGLLVGGLCLIEMSNELTIKSVNLYNANATPGRSAVGLQTIKLGVTDGGHLGLTARF